MRILVVVAIIILGIFLNKYVGNHNMGVLNPKGLIANAEKNLLITTLNLMFIVVVPVFLMLFGFAWKYRASNTKAKYTPDWHSNQILEIICWIVPGTIVATLAVITWTSTHELDPFKPIISNTKPITIQVVALDWKWLFIYPEEHIATVNYVLFPKNTPVNFQITSDAPMNAFWIPQLGTQVYAMSGMTAKLHLISHEEGVYKGLSTNFSGEGFSGMKFETHVTSYDEYIRWLNTVRGSPYSLTFEKYTQLARPTKNHSVEYYASTEENLYTRIIMKYMPSMKQLPSSLYQREGVSQDMDVEAMNHMESH